MKKVKILDGGMGTMLQREGVDVKEIPETLNIENPEIIIKIHKSYIDAGSDIIYANTFGAYSFKFKDSKYNFEEVIKAGINNAKKACEGTSSIVALDMGATGKMIEPNGTMTFDEAYGYFKEKVIAGSDADIIVIETMSDLFEMKAALLAAKENSDKPVLCTMSFEKNLRTFTGCSLSAMALTLESLGADAIGINCSVGPKELKNILEELAKWYNKNIIIKPNAGLPDGDGNYDVSAEEFGKCMKEFTKYGIAYAGGCCGTTPEYIKYVKEVFGGADASSYDTFKNAVCTPTVTVEISDDTVIGETKQLSDIAEIIDDAFDQSDNGADIISVNLNRFSLPAEATDCIKQIQEMISTPLNIICENDEILKQAIRVYNGKPMING